MRLYQLLVKQCKLSLHDLQPFELFSQPTALVAKLGPHINECCLGLLQARFEIRHLGARCTLLDAQPNKRFLGEACTLVCRSEALFAILVRFRKRHGLTFRESL